LLKGCVGPRQKMVNKNNLLQAKNISEIKRIRFFVMENATFMTGKLNLRRRTLHYWVTENNFTNSQ